MIQKCINIWCEHYRSTLTVSRQMACREPSQCVDCTILTASCKWLRKLHRSLEGRGTSHWGFKVSIHLTVQLVNCIDGDGEVDEEFPDFLQAFLLLDFSTLGERLQEIGLVRSSVNSSLKATQTFQTHTPRVFCKQALCPLTWAPLLNIWTCLKTATQVSNKKKEGCNWPWKAAAQTSYGISAGLLHKLWWYWLGWGLGCFHPCPRPLGSAGRLG